MMRLKQGDREAFEQLVERNTNKVHALVYRFLGNSGLVEDLTQEVFMRIYRTAPRYRPAAKFSTWLYRIVANLSFNVLRDRKKSREVSMDTGGSEETQGAYRNLPEAGAERPHQGLDTDELSDQVAKAVAELPDNQRLAIILNKYEDQSYEDVAEVLDCSTMAVKSLLSRARASLRESLSRYLEK